MEGEKSLVDTLGIEISPSASGIPVASQQKPFICEALVSEDNSVEGVGEK